MHPVRKQRLITVIFIILGSSGAVALMMMALSENMNVFYPPSKIVSGEAPLNKTIRAGGCVIPGTVTRAADSLQVAFNITDGIDEIGVSYEGLLPDLFAEGEAVVLTGQLASLKEFVASEVLAKHDESYTPAEVQDTVKTDTSEDYAEHARSCKGINYGT